jgi:hypothetical protein
MLLYKLRIFFISLVVILIFVILESLFNQPYYGTYGSRYSKQVEKNYGDYIVKLYSFISSEGASEFTLRIFDAKTRETINIEESKIFNSSDNRIVDRLSYNCSNFGMNDFVVMSMIDLDFDDKKELILNVRYKKTVQDFVESDNSFQILKKVDNTFVQINPSDLPIISIIYIKYLEAKLILLMNTFHYFYIVYIWFAFYVLNKIVNNIKLKSKHIKIFKTFYIIVFSILIIYLFFLVLFMVSPNLSQPTPKGLE